MDKTAFQTPVNILDGYEEAAARQRAYLLCGGTEFPGPEEAAMTVWNAVNDGKDQINYPADSVCRKLIEEYQNTHVEEFKKHSYHLICDGTQS